MFIPGLCLSVGGAVMSVTGTYASTAGAERFIARARVSTAARCLKDKRRTIGLHELVAVTLFGFALGRAHEKCIRRGAISDGRFGVR